MEGVFWFVVLVFAIIFDIWCEKYKPSFMWLSAVFIISGVLGIVLFFLRKVGW